MIIKLQLYLSKRERIWHVVVIIIVVVLRFDHLQSEISTIVWRVSKGFIGIMT